MATTIQIQDPANLVLDEYKDQLETEMPGVTVNKGVTGGDSIIAVLFPKLAPERQRKLIKEHPELAKYAKK